MQHTTSLLVTFGGVTPHVQTFRNGCIKVQRHPSFLITVYLWRINKLRVAYILFTLYKTYSGTPSSNVYTVRTAFKGISLNTFFMKSYLTMNPHITHVLSKTSGICIKWMIRKTLSVLLILQVANINSKIIPKLQIILNVNFSFR